MAYFGQVSRNALLLATFMQSGRCWSQETRQPQPLNLQHLRAGFADPPPAARLRCYWWWLNGNTDKATITHDLEEMKAKGFGGALLVDANGADQDGNAPVPAGPTFASPAWVELYTHALKEADRLGLEITLNITSGWNLGGPSVTPEQASKILTWSVTDLHGGAAAPLRLPMPESKNGFYKQVAVLAYPLAHGTEFAAQSGALPADLAASGRPTLPILQARSAAAEAGFSMPDTSAMLIDMTTGKQGGTSFSDTGLSEVRDITSQVAADGTIHWTAPQGEWEILRIGYTDSGAKVSTGSGAWQGLAIDYLSRASFEAYWNQVVEPLMVAARPFHSLKYLATDSWELGGTNWTQDFREQFQRRRGYDPVPWLPVIAGRIIESRDQSTRFLTDLRRTVADLVASEHYDVFAEKARQHGMGVEAESGGPHGAPIDALETFRSAAVPQTEFWAPNAHRPNDKDRFFTKEASSAAHIYGQRFIAEEGETSVGPQWSESLATDLKPSFDMGITEGMNRLVWHEFTSSPASSGLPGQEYFAGTHLDPKVTWFNAGGAFFTYLNRVQFLMQQGHPVNDLLYFYGDNVPNFVRLKADDPAHVLPGYDYDVTNEDALLHKIDMQGGRLRGPSGMEWKALALPLTGRVSLGVLQKVESYVRSGGVVIGLAPSSPTGMTTPATQAAFNALVAKVWGNECMSSVSRAYGKGQVFCMQDAHAAFQAMKMPADLSVLLQDSAALKAGSATELDYIHQQIGDVDVYFLRNGSGHISRHEVAFRVAGKSVELWDAVSGEMLRSAEPRRIEDGRVSMSIELPPFGSIFVVFTKDEARGVPQVSSSWAKVPLKTLEPWEITFQQGRGGPETPIRTEALEDWSRSGDPAVRFFSGTATYTNKIVAPEARHGKRVWLQFSDVREIAQVKINGRDAGTVWAKPLMLRVDPFLKPGVNRIEIEVTNLWPNRIIGDLQPGVTERITSTNITKFKPDSHLLSSGLIGSIQWMIEP
jgi:hypothetical protein